MRHVRNLTISCNADQCRAEHAWSWMHPTPLPTAITFLVVDARLAGWYCASKGADGPDFCPEHNGDRPRSRPGGTSPR